MEICYKCNNVNVEWNGEWKQCKNCGEVLERKALPCISTRIQAQLKKGNKSLSDIAGLPSNLTLMGKLTSRFNLMMS